jgi:hypothetical protein
MFPNEQENWLALYKAALLELDLQKMPERIALANKALQERSRELQKSCGHYGEKLEIQYAKRNLQAAERMRQWHQENLTSHSRARERPPVPMFTN